MPTANFTLPFRERARLNLRACASHRRGKGECCGLLISGREGRLELWFLDHPKLSDGKWTLEENDLSAVRRSIRSHDMKVVGTFHSGPIHAPHPIASDLGAMSQESLELAYDVRTQEARLWRISRNGGRQVVVELPLVAEPLAPERSHGSKHHRDWRFKA
jgi:proteasome lid subunit RPN8/RPN11